MRDGVIVLESGREIRPATTRQAFLACFSEASLLVENGGYRTYGAGPELVRGRVFELVVTFEGETLRMVRLIPDVGLDPDSYRRAKVANDEWLTSLSLPPENELEWGSVRSTVDIRSGVPEINILCRTGLRGDRGGMTGS